ncbi:unnamed protein product, partial [Leptidea sinapis]
MSILKIIMVNTYCAIAASENEYIKYIKEGPGLLFDPVGTLKLIDDYLHIVIPIDVTSFDQNIKYTQDVLNIVKLQCQESIEIDISVCQNIMQPLDSLYNDILRDYNSISHIISSERPKRSAWFSSHIFGTLDEDDAINYNRAIETLYDNEKVYVSKSAISNINQSVNEILENQFKLNDAINNLSTNVRNISNLVTIDSFKVKLINILNCLQSHLFTLAFKIEDLLNSILFIKSNTLHPSVLTPKQLYNDLLNGYKNIPKYKDLPINVDLSNIHVLINVADLISYYYN